MLRFTINPNELHALPTIRQGHFCNLKIETPELRVWASRCSIADGETEPTQIEWLQDRRWVSVRQDVRLRDPLGNMFTIRWIGRGIPEHKLDFPKRTYFELPVFQWTPPLTCF
jgi:hypothetical protein